MQKELILQFQKKFCFSPFSPESKEYCGHILFSFCDHGLIIKFKSESVQIDSDNRGRLTNKILSQQRLSLWEGEAFVLSEESEGVRDHRGGGSLFLPPPPKR